MAGAGGLASPAGGAGAGAVLLGLILARCPSQGLARPFEIAAPPPRRRFNDISTDHRRDPPVFLGSRPRPAIPGVRTPSPPQRAAYSRNCVRWTLSLTVDEPLRHALRPSCSTRLGRCCRPIPQKAQIEPRHEPSVRLRGRGGDLVSPKRLPAPAFDMRSRFAPGPDRPRAPMPGI